jgi:hypothetical protein
MIEIYKVAGQDILNSLVQIMLNIFYKLDVRAKWSLKNGTGIRPSTCNLYMIGCPCLFVLA